MNAEVFQVFTSFYLQAEGICREVNAQLWMESVEGLVQNLGVAGQDTLTLLERMKEESEIHIEEQRNIAATLLDGLEDVTHQQSVHFTRELEFFNTSQEAMRNQEANLLGISHKLSDLHVALGAFVSMICSIRF